MGRKPKAAKPLKIANMPEGPRPYLVTKKSKPELHEKSSSLSTRKEALKDKSVVVRRSGRLQNLIPPNCNQEIQAVAEEINLVESDREDEPRVDQRNFDSEPLSLKSLEEKHKNLVTVVMQLNAKVTEMYDLSRSPSKDLNYKSLYLHSQQKVEALTDENYQLGKKLEIALAKLEMYEDMKKMIGQFKDAMLVSNLTKAAEALANLSSPGSAVEPDAAVVPQASRANEKKRSKRK